MVVLVICEPPPKGLALALAKLLKPQGYCRSSIALWKKRYLAAKGSVDSPEYQKLLKENKTLREEIEHLEIINDVLKKARPSSPKIT